MLAGEQLENVTAFERIMAAERARLLRWCLRLVGDRETAEDLVQETLSAAWRSTRRPALEQEYPAWLAGIARNLCRAWLRSQRREAARHIRLLVPEPEAEPGQDSSADLADTLDLETLLERKELIDLLERALALLPPATRALLLAKYIEEFPLSEIAARLRISEGAAASRLARGKVALRHVLATNLSQETSAYGLAPLKTGAWSETSIWCPGCGQRRLLAQLSPETGAFLLRCPCCFSKLPVNMAHWNDQGMFQGTTSYRTALSRLSAWGHHYYHQGLAAGTARCTGCGQVAPARMAQEEDVPEPFRAMRCIVVRCSACGRIAITGATGLILCHPQVQQFWRARPRLQTLPERSLEHQGRPAYLTSFASLRDSARLDVLWDRETCAILTIAGGPQT
jgi:RNA polymerase sigma-70 factor (ECF subfamily)